MAKEDILSILGAIGLIMGMLFVSLYLESIEIKPQSTSEEEFIKNAPIISYGSVELKELYQNTHYAFFVLYNPELDENISFDTLDYISYKKPYNSQHWQNIYVFNKVPKLDEIQNYPNEGNSNSMENYLKRQKPLIIMVNFSSSLFGKSVCIYRENTDKYDYFANNQDTQFKWINYENEVWRCLPND